jgi:hypothetical protein
MALPRQAPAQPRSASASVHPFKPMTNFDVRERVYHHAPQTIPSDVFNVLVFLSHFAKATGVCWPKNETIARYCRLDERRVRRAIKWLEDNRQLLVNRRPGRGKFSYYGIITGLDEAGVAGVARAMLATEQAHQKAPTPIDEKPTCDAPFSGENLPGEPPIDEKRGQEKGGMAEAELSVTTPDGEGIKNISGSRIHTTTPLPPTEPTPPAAQRAEQQRGGGGETATPIGRNRTAEQPAQAQQPSANAETVAALQAAGVRVYWRFAHLPAEVVKAAAAQVATARKADDRGALVANLLNAYTRGEWVPTEPEPAAPAVRVSDLPILLYQDISGTEKQRWQRRFASAEPAARPRILADFFAEYPDARAAAAV